MKSSPHLTPTPLPQGITSRHKRAMIHRVRLEHLSVELLRQCSALTIPVPIEQIWREPLGNYWDALPPLPQPPPEVEGSYGERMTMAWSIADAVGKSAWPDRVRMLGTLPFSPPDVSRFARALMIPTQLLGRLNAAQKTPVLVSTIFEVPESEAHERLRELGFDMSGDN